MRRARRTTSSSSTSSTTRTPTRSPRSAASRAGSRCSSARAGVDDDNVFFQNSQAADAQRLDVRDRARRGHRARARRAQPLLLQGRHRGHAAPLLRPHRLPDGRRSRGPAAEDAAGRDRHDGPVHRDAGQQAGAVRRPGAGRLPASTRSRRPRRTSWSSSSTSTTSIRSRTRCSTTGVPPGAVDRRRPAGADRRGLRRAGRAGAAVDRRRATRSTTSGWRSSTPSTIPTRRTRCSTRCCPNKDGEGYRLDEQGRRLSIIFELDQTRTTFLDMFELVIPMFQAVGIDAQIRTMDRSLWEDARPRRPRVRRDGAPVRRQQRHRRDARRPLLRAVQRQLALRARAGRSTSPTRTIRTRSSRRPTSRRSRSSTASCSAPPIRQQQNEMMAQILENAADQFLVCGVSLPPDGYGVVKNNMVNRCRDDAELVRLADARTRRGRSSSSRPDPSPLTLVTRRRAGLRGPGAAAPLPATDTGRCSTPRPRPPPPSGRRTGTRRDALDPADAGRGRSGQVRSRLLDRRLQAHPVERDLPERRRLHRLLPEQGAAPLRQQVHRRQRPVRRRWSRAPASLDMHVMARVDPHAIHQDAADAHPEWIAVDKDGNKRRHWAYPGRLGDLRLRRLQLKSSCPRCSKEITRDYDIDADLRQPLAGPRRLLLRRLHERLPRRDRPRAAARSPTPTTRSGMAWTGVAPRRADPARRRLGRGR